MQQAVQEQLQPAATPVGPYRGTHEASRGAGGGGEGGWRWRRAGAGGRPSNPNPNPVRKNHACETCGKAFRDVYHLNRHRLSHSDEKPFSCPICQQRFKRKDRMSHHVRSHQGGVEKPYVCPHCAKAFSRPDHLNSHVRQVHSSERPFKCPTCESSFATRDRLRAHMIRHEEKVPCHICGKLLSAAYITDHMRVHNQSQHHSCHICNRSECLSTTFYKLLINVSRPPERRSGLSHYRPSSQPLP
uniref:MYC associated zinc finger protein n=1 Tax=Salmo trutta TaxID=8032 RepID=A0A674E080_SALTR